MARGGFLSRIGRAIKSIVAPPPRQPPREPPPQPPEPPEPPGKRDYKDAWKDHNGKGNYRKHLKVFNAAMDSVNEDDPDERLRLWKSYIANIVAPRGRERRQSTSNMFWRDSGIDPQDWNWKAWREAMGYTGKRRSRTP